MSQIKKFIDRVANAEGRQLREVLMPITEAKELRDEVMKLILDKQQKPQSDEVVEIVVNGGKW
jgi:hypothetical protein